MYFLPMPQMGLFVVVVVVVVTVQLSARSSHPQLKILGQHCPPSYFEASDIVSDVSICPVGHSIYHIRHFEYYQLLFHTFSSDIMSDVLAQNVGHGG